MFRKTLLLLLFFASVPVLCQGPPPRYHRPYVWDRRGGQGKEWLNWSRERRRGYAYGYLTGYHVAFGAACVAYADASPPATLPADLEDVPEQKCIERRPNYNHGTDYYEEAITNYYKKYPSDLDLPTAWLFLGFSESEHKSPEDMHRAWTNHVQA